MDTAVKKRKKCHSRRHELASWQFERNFKADQRGPKIRHTMEAEEDDVFSMVHEIVKKGLTNRWQMADGRWQMRTLGP